jgi:hypothetical protein
LRKFRQLKNRKSARECRKKRKSEREEMITELDQIKLEQKNLAEQLKQAQE